MECGGKFQFDLDQVTTYKPTAAGMQNAPPAPLCNREGIKIFRKFTEAEDDNTMTVVAMFAK